MSATHSRDVKTMAEARREFAGKRSPWLIAAVILILVVARAFAGEVTWQDGVAAVAMLAIYPLGEWAIHVYLLHMRPFEFRGRRDRPARREGTSRPPPQAERPHDHPARAEGHRPAPVHRDAGLDRRLGGAAEHRHRLGPGRRDPDGGAHATILIGIYEWTHFLIHTAYRPRSRYYRSIWRTHRLHHFKNEHFWHGITNTVGDRVLGTFPDHREVPRSKTARTLDPEAAGTWPAPGAR